MRWFWVLVVSGAAQARACPSVITAVSAEECPNDPGILPSCGDVGEEELCQDEEDECASEELNNCESFDVYRVPAGSVEASGASFQTDIEGQFEWSETCGGRPWYRGETYSLLFAKRWEITRGTCTNATTAAAYCAEDVSTPAQCTNWFERRSTTTFEATSFRAYPRVCPPVLARVPATECSLDDVSPCDYPSQLAENGGTEQLCDGGCSVAAPNYCDENKTRYRVPAKFIALSGSSNYQSELHGTYELSSNTTCDGMPVYACLDCGDANPRIQHVANHYVVFFVGTKNSTSGCVDDESYFKLACDSDSSTPVQCAAWLEFLDDQWVSSAATVAAACPPSLREAVECPHNPDLAKCSSPTVSAGDLCEDDDECGDDALNNCDGFDVYKVLSPEWATPSPTTPAPTTANPTPLGPTAAPTPTERPTTGHPATLLPTESPTTRRHPTTLLPTLVPTSSIEGTVTVSNVGPGTAAANGQVFEEAIASVARVPSSTVRVSFAASDSRRMLAEAATTAVVDCEYGIRVATAEADEVEARMSALTRTAFDDALRAAAAANDVSDIFASVATTAISETTRTTTGRETNAPTNTSFATSSSSSSGDTSTWAIVAVAAAGGIGLLVVAAGLLYYIVFSVKKKNHNVVVANMAPQDNDDDEAPTEDADGPRASEEEEEEANTPPEPEAASKDTASRKSVAAPWSRAPHNKKKWRATRAVIINDER